MPTRDPTKTFRSMEWICAKSVTLRHGKKTKENRRERKMKGRGRTDCHDIEHRLKLDQCILNTRSLQSKRNMTAWICDKQQTLSRMNLRKKKIIDIVVIRNETSWRGWLNIHREILSLDLSTGRKINTRGNSFFAKQSTWHKYLPVANPRDVKLVSRQGLRFHDPSRFYIVFRNHWCDKIRKNVGLLLQ